MVFLLRVLSYIAFVFHIGFASAGTSTIEQRMVSTEAEGLAACNAMYLVKKTCSTNQELLTRGCSGCGRPGSTSGTQYCQATEYLYLWL